MAVQYDDTGDEVVWMVKAGDPIVKTWLITEDPGATAVDISAATLTGAIRASEDVSLTPVATFTMSKPSVSGNNAVKALVSAGIADVGSYWWAIKVAMADGETVYRGQGMLVVEPKGV